MGGRLWSGKEVKMKPTSTATTFNLVENPMSADQILKPEGQKLKKKKNRSVFIIIIVIIIIR